MMISVLVSITSAARENPYGIAVSHCRSNVGGQAAAMHCDCVGTHDMALPAGERRDGKTVKIVVEPRRMTSMQKPRNVSTIVTVNARGQLHSQSNNRR